MSRSSVDINCPAYSPSEQEVKYSSNILEDVIEGYSVRAEYGYYLHDKQVRIVNLKVYTNWVDIYMEEVIVELIQLHEGKTTLLETKMEIL